MERTWDMRSCVPVLRGGLESTLRGMKTSLILEGEAEAARRGLWVDDEPVAPWDWRRSKPLRDRPPHSAKTRQSDSDLEPAPWPTPLGGLNQA